MKVENLIIGNPYYWHYNGIAVGGLLIEMPNKQNKNKCQFRNGGHTYYIAPEELYPTMQEAHATL